MNDRELLELAAKAAWHVQWQWRAWRLTGDRVGTMRYANAKGYFLGPLFVCRPMPWLLGPARSLHPEAFDGCGPVPRTVAVRDPANAKVSGAGTASAGLPGYTAGDNTE